MTLWMINYTMKSLICLFLIVIEIDKRRRITLRDDTTDNHDNNEKEQERNTKIPGNTLDYYNEDLTRNAVQGLFTPGEAPRRSGKKDAIVAGYDEDNSSLKPPPQRKRKAAALQDIDDKMEERPARTARREPARREEDPIPKRPAKSEEGFAPQKPIGVGSRNEKVEDIDYDRYRVRDRYRPRPEEKKEPAAGAGTRTVSREREEQRPPQKVSQRAPYTTFKREPYRAKPLTADSPADELDDYQDESFPLSRVILISASVVVLIIFAALIFKINSTSKKLDEAMAKLAPYEENGDYNTLSIQLDAERNKNQELQAQLDEYKLSGVEPVDTENSQGSTEEQNNVSSQATGDVIHIVMAGESLSKISSNYYGTIQGVQKIKDANGLTSDNLNIGQELTIPDVPSDGQ